MAFDFDFAGWWQAAAAIVTIVAAGFGWQQRQIRQLVRDESDARKAADAELAAQILRHEKAEDDFKQRIWERLADASTKSDIAAVDRRIDTLIQSMNLSKGA
jgi:hypothetical protein